jgi:hypothetical protein
MNTCSQFVTLTMQALLLICLVLPQAAQAALIDNGDGTVTDTATGLMWDKCSQGQSRTTCASGSAFTMPWTAALKAAVAANKIGYKGYNDWRLPNKNELETIVDISVATDPAINLTAFPATPASGDYWSSTTCTPSPTEAWVVVFTDGGILTNEKDSGSLVRLVRSGL